MRALGGGRWETIRSVTLPGALPYILTGIRSGLGFGWRALIAAELVGAATGLGTMIFDAAEYHRSDIIIAGCLIIGTIAIVMDRWLLLPIERRTVAALGPGERRRGEALSRGTLHRHSTRTRFRLLVGPDVRRFIAGVLLIAVDPVRPAGLRHGDRQPAPRSVAARRHRARAMSSSCSTSCPSAFTTSAWRNTASSPDATARSTALRLRIVSPDNLRALSDVAWVARIEPLK